MAGNRTADELLRWGLAHSNQEHSHQTIAQVSDDIAAGRRPDLADPELYNTIMGKSDAQRMSEELIVAADPARAVSDRKTALDNFEMLIELIDNANNMEPLGMWPTVIGLCAPSNDPQIQALAAWIIGTAIQNNDKGQVVALTHGALPALLPLLSSPHTETRSRALYAVSALLRHFPRAVTDFDAAGSWTYLRAALADPAMAVRRKCVFVISQLLVQLPAPHSSAPAAAPAAAAPRATSTAMIPADSQPAHDSGVVPSAPLEEGPATLKLGTAFPDVLGALLSSGTVAALIGLMLSPAQAEIVLGPGGLADANREVAMAARAAGPTVWEDLDFAEKGATVIALLISKTANARPLPVEIVRALLADLNGPPAEPAESATRAQEIGLAPEYLHTLEQYTS